MRKRPPSLRLELLSLSPSPSKDGRRSTLGTTYRADGLSIGRDYLRYEGSTLSRGDLSPSDLEIEGTLGRGACSVVLRARRRTRKRPSESENHGRNDGDVGGGDRDSGTDDDENLVALKVFPLRDEGRREMLARELRALCRLRCDCLVRLEGAFFDKDDGSVAMVLEYMDRGSLADVLRCQRRRGGSVDGGGDGDNVAAPRRRLDERVVAAVAYQALWALAYLRHENVVHRDVKPGNVLVNSRGQVKLSDLGVASLREDGRDMNATVVGTARYMSPERLRARSYGTSSDIWSLGLVLLEVATGSNPFNDITSVVELVQTVEESSMTDFIPPTLSHGLQELLASCLQYHPEKRIPADILLVSPWFESNEISTLETAVGTFHEFIRKEEVFPLDI